MENSAALLAFAALAGLFMLFIFAWFVVAYVFLSMGLMTIAKNRGIENPWLAWIPVANLYIMGLLVPTVTVSSYKIEKLELVLPISCAASVLLGWIPLIGFLISLAAGILSLIVFYQLVRQYRPDKAIMYTVLGAIVSPVGAYMFYTMRNDIPVAPPAV